MPQFTGLSRIGQLQRWIRTTCNRAGVRAEFKDGIPTAYATKNSVVIPRITCELTDDDEALLRFQICHEGDGHHNAGPDIFDIAEKNNIDMRKPLGAILNIIEDHRVEAVASKAYAGNALIISNGREVTGRRSLEMIQDLVSKLTVKDLADDTAKMQSVYLCMLLAHAEWCPGSRVHLFDEIETTTSRFPDTKKYIKKLIDFGFVTSILGLRNEYESWDLAKRTYALLWDKTEQEVEQEIEEQIANADTGDGDGKKEKGEGGKADKVGDGPPTSGSVDPRTGKYTLPYEYFVKSSHGQDENSAESMVGHGLGLDYTKHTPRVVFNPYPFHDFTVRNYRLDPPTNSGTLAKFGGTLEQLTSNSAFANRMRRFLQVRSASYYEGGKTKGLINARSVYRAGLPVIGSGEWNRKVFKNKVTSDMLDCAVSLVVDISGSMSGPKVVHAAQGCMMLNNVISNVLRVNTEILTFTHFDTPWVYVIKSFGERVPDDTVYARIDDSITRMYGNDDADVLLYAYDRLLAQRNKRKVLIILSDGSPADGLDGTDPCYALKRTVREIEDAKVASIIGIGIMDNSVREFYKHHTIIKRAEELEDCLLTVINDQILNGVTH